ncbi:NADH-quinone oxidoreductase subunit E [Aliidongia dinghuensis]|uniref:NADH-quinone oxidoreductase subunit E n=1 Tax=Aliidongia dinghuensis TaxID=1867774 RepID=A0A8J3E4Z1_9PROT|nr:formate dehydrogenase subunit gamma [Aliidongia dinghuensis]GGF31234.1 NADH-quinone oxidoreductase subunit E [Aliidongia dinghuensis]
MAHSAPFDPATAREVIDGLKHLPGATLPILHALQDRFGYVDPAAVPLIADALNLSRAEIHGVIGFYHEFRGKPAGAHVIQLCRAEACQSMGCRDLQRHAEERLGVAMGGTRADGAATLDAVYCLGNCALSPAVMIDGTLHGRVDAARFDALVAELPAFRGGRR